MKKIGTVLVIIAAFVLLAIFIPKAKSVYTMQDQLSAYVLVGSELWDVKYSGWNASYGYSFDQKKMQVAAREKLASKRYKDRDTAQFNLLHPKTNALIEVIAVKKNP